MRYSERVHLIKVEETEGPLGPTVTETVTEYPCYSQNLSLEEQNTAYGKRVESGLKLCIPAEVSGYSKALYKGKTYSIGNTKPFRRSTVLYLVGG